MKVNSSTSYLLSLCVILLFGFSCSQQSNWSSIIDWPDFKISDLPGENDYPEAGAIILLDEATIENFGSGESAFTIYEKHRIVKILNTRGYQYANVAVSYNPTSSIELLEARTISPAGTISKVREADIYDINLYPNFVFYSDQRAKIFTFPAIEAGAILEYRYQINIRGTTFGNVWNFQNYDPTLISRFTLLKFSELEFDYKISGVDLQPQIKEAPEGFKETYIWEANNLPEIKHEVAMPPLKEVGARLIFSQPDFKSWQEIINWYYDLTASQTEADTTIRNLTNKLTVGLTDNSQKVRTIFEWIRDHIRYISVSIGIGGYRPHKASDVLHNRYGDCKDMTTLLCSMAKIADIDVYQAIISTRQNGIPDTSMPSTAQFNHVIAYCPSAGDSGVWMDATEKGCPYGQLPWYDQNLPVLVVDENENTSEFSITPTVKPEKNKNLLRWQIDLAENGDAQISGSTHLWGANASELRQTIMDYSGKDLQRWLQTYLDNKCPGSELDTFKFVGLQAVKDPLIISYTFAVSNFAASSQKALLFRPAEIKEMELTGFFKSKQRQHPLRFRFGMQMICDLTITIPDGYGPENFKQNQRIRSQFGFAKWDWYKSGNLLRIRDEFQIQGGEIASSSYHDFREFLERIRVQNTRYVMLKEGADLP